ncbi:hypothetical protein [Knoellia subterranea]|uniref:Gram-positive cocci surface proteins LPxTG domain-containing protein n=1 Tax=Knoellia subterranea KCTC 19937 TaxID=1385521 RepID=A0A0A0JPR7_9MICO|nr:hypothetical protein [Knoellia subterranea]KGN39153.1 hypothetical protein N803_01190 [Knoellia subterranea KCTC 19937]
MTVVRRVLGSLIAATLLTAGLVGASAPASAAVCSTTSGVSVVIQSAEGTSTHCVSGDPSSALSALRAVASVTEVATQPGFVCQINGYPNTNCTRTPPGSAYWAFFHGPAGGSWTYSQSGAGSYNPAPGSSIGFRFGSGSAPSVGPASPSTPKPTATPQPTTATPRPTTTAPRQTTVTPRAPSRAPTSATTPGTSATTPPGSAATSTPGGSAAAPSGTATAAAPPGTSASASSPNPTDTGTVAAQKPLTTGSGSSGRLVGGGVLLLALAAAVAAVALRRRATSRPQP